MYEIFKNALKGDYELVDMLNKIGDKITYNGKKYVCKMNGCVWNPDEYPSGWEEVVSEESA